MTRTTNFTTAGGREERTLSGDAVSEPRNFAVIDGRTGEIDARLPKINLSSLDDVRLEMSKVYRGMKSGAIECQNGTRLVYVLGQIAKLHEATEVAARLAALERAVAPRRS